MTSFLKGLFYLATMMSWLLLCTIFAIEILGTDKHIIRDFPSWFDWTALLISLSCCTFSMWSILEVADAPKTPQEQLTKLEILKNELQEAVAKEDYETATKIRNRINFLKQTSL